MLPHIDNDKLPKHVAIIMDGNGRWAKKRLFNRIRGHEQGSETVRTIIRASREIGIPILTLYAFSTENWQRPQPEVAALMSLLKKFLISERQELTENQIRLNAIGQIYRLPDQVKETLSETMELTKNNSKMIVNLALSYGGRDELIQAIKKIAISAMEKTTDIDSICETSISNLLYTANMPDPDILIRTSGEMRISNFMLWQLAYSEIFFTNTLWPDFTKNEYFEIISKYQQRERRFGKTGEQL